MKNLLMLAAVAVCLAACGCGGEEGPELAEVGGVVTLDGQPLPEARVTFVPQAAPNAGVNSGSTSVGMTDTSGHYELGYSSSQSGAVVGQHRVQISTYRYANEDEAGNETPAAPEKVPAEYNVNSASNPEMQREVQAGSNEIKFALKSGGQIIQPASDDQVEVDTSSCCCQ